VLVLDGTPCDLGVVLAPVGSSFLSSSLAVMTLRDSTDRFCRSRGAAHALYRWFAVYDTLPRGTAHCVRLAGALGDPIEVGVVGTTAKPACKSLAVIYNCTDDKEACSR
jgi:hypothetical protein